MGAWITFPFALIGCVLFIPLVRRFSQRKGYVSMPRDERWHRSATPTLGGVAIFGAFIVSLFLFLLIQGQWEQVSWSLLISATMIFLLGLVDDIRPLSPPTKLVVQILAAAIVVFFGKTIAFFPWGFANIVLTFFWLVGITNALNLLDNMDGLAGGIALIAAGFISYFFMRGENQPLLAVSLALSGSLLGFLLYNFPPAKIFMGDSGSLFLGFTLAALAVAYRPRASNIFTVLGVPTLLFLLPILDTALVTFTRILRGQSPSQGGTDHTSHRLIAFGFSERQAVLFLYGIGIVSGITGTVLEALDYDLSLVLIPVLIIALALLTAYLGRLKVVTSYDQVTAKISGGSISRLMVDLTYRRRIFEIILDFFLVGVSYYLSFWTLSGFQLDQDLLELFLRTLPIALAGAYSAFIVFGVYRGVWRFVGIDDLVRYGRATVGAVLLVAIPLIVVYPSEALTAEIFFLFGVFLFLGLVASRGSFRILDRIFGGQQSTSEQLNVLIYGAGDAGEIALRWIQRNPDLGYRPVGFIDDDQYKHGRMIHGITVIGGMEIIEEIREDRKISGLILAADPGGEYSISKIVDICREKGLWVRALRLDFELLG